MLRRSRSKVLSKIKIDKISAVPGFDVWRLMVWCDTAVWLVRRHIMFRIKALLGNQGDYYE
jgi:hypothetical protein